MNLIAATVQQQIQARGRKDAKVAVIAWTLNKNGKVRYVLITSTGNRVRWTLPKGTVEEGKTDEQVALEECYEEGGVRGRRLKKLPGSYKIEGLPLTVFVMKVTKVLRNWPEHHERGRRLVSFKRAQEMLKKGGKKNKAMLKALRDAHAQIKKTVGK